MELDKLGVLTSFIHNIVVYNIPLLYGTVGEIVVEKSGSLNLGVEGIMAVGAIIGYIVGCYANSLAVGILMAFLTAALCGLLFAVLTVSLQANQNITGLTLTTFGLGVYFFVGNGLKSHGWPVMGDYANIKAGSANSVGINVKRMKYLHICLGCGIMGIGGYYMGLNMSGSFNSSCWINGYGWIAVALVIFANWNPVMAIGGTFVFGFFNTLRVSASSLAAAFPGLLGWLGPIPTQVYQALPFVITAIVLVASFIRTREGSGLPASLGVNYFREER